MTPEPVPSALEKKKLFSPRGEIILFMAPGGDYGPVEPVSRGSRAKKKNPPGGQIFLEPVYSKKMWVDPKKG